MSQKNEHSYNISKFFLKVNQLLWRKSFMQNIRSVFYYVDAILLMLCKRAPRKTKIDNHKKKVLIVYNLALGDGIMFYEVSKSIRSIWPREQYEISIACQKAFKSLYESAEVYDKVIPLDFTGSVMNLKKRKALFEELRQEVYDVVVDPVGSEDCTTNVFVARAVIGKEKIGVLDTTLRVHQMSSYKRKHIYNKIVEIDKKDIHLIQYYADFFEALGAKDVKACPAKLPQVKLEVTLPKKFFVVFPVASMDVKKWNLKNYACLTKKIIEKTGLPLVICGTDHDRGAILEMLSYIPDIKPIDIIGQTSIMQFTQVIGMAELVVTNDTSAYHIAVARQVPTVMICGGYTYDRYAHYQYEQDGFKDPILVTNKMDCYNCNNHCKYQDFKVFPCIERITIENAWNVIEEVIKKEGLNK